MMNHQNYDWIVFFLRVTIGILFISCGFAFISGIHFFTKPPSEIKPWFPLDFHQALGYFWAGSLLVLGLLLVIGYRTAVASIASIVILLSIHLCWMIANPFHNTLKHIVPYLLIAVSIYTLSANSNIFSADNYLKRKSHPVEYSVVTLTFRLLVGFIFLMQGVASMSKGPLAFAEKVYVERFADTSLPSSLLWLLGVINPFIQIVGGGLLIVGLFTRATAIGLSFFMLTIVVGHMFGDPFETAGGLSSHGLNNFLCILAVLYFVAKANKYSVDWFLKNRR